MGETQPIINRPAFKLEYESPTRNNNILDKEDKDSSDYDDETDKSSKYNNKVNKYSTSFEVTKIIEPLPLLGAGSYKEEPEAM